MKIRCEACGNYVQKEFTTKVKNIYGKSDYEEVVVCSNCAAKQHSIHDMTFHKELHLLMREREAQLKREKKELKKQLKKEKEEKAEE